METEQIREIGIELIDDPHSPMRSELDREALFELAEDIKRNGLINPITVRPVGERFEVVAGHRRFSACKIAGKIKISCVVRELTDNQVMEIMVAENLKRQDVNPVDEADTITRYMQTTGKNEKEVAEVFGYSEAWVKSRLEVGRMPDYMRGYLKTGQLKLGAALILFQVDKEPLRQQWVDLAVRDGISIAQADYWLADYRRRILPGGNLSGEPATIENAEPPSAMKFACAIDGKEYDQETARSILVYKGNLEVFQYFAVEYKKGLASEPGPAGPAHLGHDTEEAPRAVETAPL